jgi:two-component system chemotaxis response regulator CheY
MEETGMTILVVDDSKIMRNIVKKHFDVLGYKCDYIEADNGMTALQLLRSHPVQLVLLDWNMPQLSGLDFLKTVRAMPQYAELPIVMVTSESARYNMVEALKNGATDYIIKPINEKNFKDKISKIDFSKAGK